MVTLHGATIKKAQGHASTPAVYFIALLLNEVPDPYYLSFIALRFFGVYEKDWFQYFDCAFKMYLKVETAAVYCFMG